MCRRFVSIPVSVARFTVIGLSAVLCLFAGCGSGAPLDPDDPTGQVRIYEPDLQPVRGLVRPLLLRRGDFTYRCSECHRSFQSAPGRKVLVAEHMGVKLDHGNNDYCLNCHHFTNREAYAAQDGSEISSDQSERLCAKCHGLIHRDWKAGIHGRRSGFWNPAMGTRDQLACIQCHDPHAPKFKQLSPMPGPQTVHRHEKEGEG